MAFHLFSFWHVVWYFIFGCKWSQCLCWHQILLFVVIKKAKRQKHSLKIWRECTEQGNILFCPVERFWNPLKCMLMFKTKEKYQGHLEKGTCSSHHLVQTLCNYITTRPEIVSFKWIQSSSRHYRVVLKAAGNSRLCQWFGTWVDSKVWNVFIGSEKQVLLTLCIYVLWCTPAGRNYCVRWLLLWPCSHQNRAKTEVELPAMTSLVWLLA